MSTPKEDIQAAIQIDQYIGRYVKLKKAGKSWKGLCPFHNEKTPSFSVSPDRGFFHCFGCGRSGDIFSFVMEIEQVGFREALEMLAQFAGIELKHDQNSKSDPRQPLFELNSKVKQLFVDYFNSESGHRYRQYLKGRHITPDAILHFQIGASPNAWDFLSTRLIEYQSDLLKLGLIRKSEHENASERVYDFYRDRIIFPIHEVSGRIAGFGGRALNTESTEGHTLAKYINSPESPVFQKKSILYGLYEGLSSIRKSRQILITEGYLDVIGLWMADITNACAPLGTAFTTEHLKLAGRYADQIYALFDGDKAGRNAALKFAIMLGSHTEIQSGIVLMPPGADAFDLTQKLSAPSLKEYLACVIPGGRYFLLETLFPENLVAYIESHPELNWPQMASLALEYYTGHKTEIYPIGHEIRRAALNRLYENLDMLPHEIERSLYLDDAAVILALNPVDLKAEFASKNQKQQYFQKSRTYHEPDIKTNINYQIPSEINVETHNKIAPEILIERELLFEILNAPSVLGGNFEKFRELEFTDLHAELLWRYLEGRYLTGLSWQLNDLSTFDLPAQTIQVFNARVLERFNGPSLDELDVDLEMKIQDLFLHHQIILLKKSMAKLSARQLVADSVEKSAIMEDRNKCNQLIKQLERQRKSL